MQIFAVGQRWTSESEPELGLGLITALDRLRVTIVFPATHESRQYAIDNNPLKRVRFKAGDSVSATRGSFTIEEVLPKDQLFFYRSANGLISEAAISGAAVSSQPQDRLLAGDVDEAHLFSLRLRTLELQQKILQSPVRGFLGARVDLIPHQLFIAQEAASRRAPRLLLADEVGLGKTIEAGLILHRLLLTGRAQRVLVLVPEPLVNQWFVEMLRKFNLWFAIYDEERCQAIESNNAETNPFLDDQILICGMDLFSASERRVTQAAEAEWDLLVIDEAHHLEWAPEDVSPEYRAAQALAKNASGVLLLTATPDQSAAHHGSAKELLLGHFARLRLLDPARYFDFETFSAETAEFGKLSRIADSLKRGEPLDDTHVEALREFTKIDSATATILYTRSGTKDTTRENILNELLDRHGPGRVTFRNTRAGVGGFPKRVPCPAPLRATSEDQLDEINAEVAIEFYPPAEIPAFEFKDDPRIDWLTDFLRAHPREKVLLISRYREKVEGLAKALRQKISLPTALFHEELSLLQRDRNAAWFAEEDGAQLLLCSEIGSEGRNFQFSHHLVLFDLPLEPELLEQRIGRLDRIGQKNEIQIHVPYIENSAQEILYRWYHDGLNAFAQIIPGAAVLGATFYTELKQLAKREINARALDDLISRTRAARIQTAERLEHGRDHLIELTSFKPIIAKGVAAQIAEAGADETVEKWLLDVFDELGIHVEELGNRSYLLGGGDLIKDKFPGLPETGLIVTASREKAVTREEIGFLTSDHPVVAGAIDSILGSAKGSCVFAVLKGASDQGLLLEAVFVFETIAPRELHASRFLPPTPIRVLIDQKLQDRTSAHPNESFEGRLSKGNPHLLLDQGEFRDELLPAMIKTAEEVASRAVVSTAGKAVAQMEAQLGSELDRLRYLRTVNPNIREEEIQIAENEVRDLRTHLSGAALRLDAIRLILRTRT